MSLLLLFLPRGGGTTISPDAVAVPLIVPAPTVTLGAITISPSPVTIPLAIPAPTVSLSLAIAPSPVTVPLVIPAPSIATGELVLVQQVNTKVDPSGAGGVVTIASTGAGHLLVAVVMMRAGSTRSVSSITDNLGQTWVHTTDGVTTATGFNPGNNGRVEIWHFPNSAAGVTTVTPTLNNTVINSVTVFEVAGVLASSPVNRVGVAANPAGGPESAGTIATSIADVIMIAGAAWTIAGETITPPGAPWVDWTTNPETGTGLANLRARGVTQIVSATGTYNPAWAVSASNPGGGAIAAFMKAGATNRLVTPDPVPLPLIVAAPTVTLGALTITPTPVAVPLVVPAPSVTVTGGTTTITPDAVAIPLAVPAPTVTTPLALAPSPVPIPLALPAPVVTLGALTVSPAPVAVPLVVPAPAVSLGAITISPSPVVIPITTPAPTVTTPYAVAPAPVPIPLAVPDPTVTVAGAQTKTPNAVPVPIVVPAPAVTLSLALAPTPVAVPLVLPAPTVSLGALTIAPAPVPIPLLVPAPTITAASNQTITPDPVPIPLVVPVPTVTVAAIPVPPVVVVSRGGGRPRGEPFTHPLPEPYHPPTTIRPDPVVVAFTVIAAHVEIDWLSKLRYEDEELLLAGIL